MRTTLDIDEDVLQAAKELAITRGRTAGQVISDLARVGLAPARRARQDRNGVPVFPARAKGAAKPSMKLVNELRDEA